MWLTDGDGSVDGPGDVMRETIVIYDLLFCFVQSKGHMKRVSCNAMAAWLSSGASAGRLSQIAAQRGKGGYHGQFKFKAQLACWTRR
jgi:hypothetical protein